jgi:hypothetical protein
MISGVAEYTKQHPDAWRRYLQIVVDGLRARPDVTPSTTPPLSSDELDAAMLCWRPQRRPAAHDRAASSDHKREEQGDHDR